MIKLYFILVFVFSFNSVRGQDVTPKESRKKGTLVVDNTDSLTKSSDNKSATRSVLNTQSRQASNANQLVLVQCTGFSPKGERCKIKVSTKNGRCFQHK